MLANPINHYRDYSDFNGIRDPRDTYIQLGVSLFLGLFAFLGFCVLRPRWPSLYAARKRQANEAATSLPELPNSLFGWIGTIATISDNQVLESAGLDAYVFLYFFKMANRFLRVTLLFAVLVMLPVHNNFPEEDKRPRKDPAKDTFLAGTDQIPLAAPDRPEPGFYDLDYLWMYLAFAYFFTGLMAYLIVRSTNEVIEKRQRYLGYQTTITDRTIRFSGVPPEYQDEKALKDFVEGLGIGKVELVSICKDWGKLDRLLAHRDVALRSLERARMQYRKTLKRYNLSMDWDTDDPSVDPLPINTGHNNAAGDGDDESDLLLPQDETKRLAVSCRPKIRLWKNRWLLRYEWVDKIGHHHARLADLDQQIKECRKKKFDPTSTAFVTMDDVASCQMAAQAVLDPSPLALIASSSPAPGDVVWTNTYLNRSQRMAQAWTITFFIFLLTIFWSVLYVPIAGVLDLDSIKKTWPRLGDTLNEHRFLRSLVQTQLPTLLLTVLNIGVTYLYNWLANMQGMISQGDVELSVISKNFFFTFFNFFLVFTALGTAYLSLDNIGNESLRETTNKLALSIQDLRKFYVNYIILQGLAIYPIRLLEFGSVFLYPFARLRATTRRELAELMQPPIFRYGLQLPQAILIFIICIVYSCLRSSWEVLLAGILYFEIGRFCLKYQLLYAMDHREASTGKSWIMICNRIVAGFIVMQISIAGQLALRGALRRSLMIIPLVASTFWLGHVFRRRYAPLMTFIALKSIKSSHYSAERARGKAASKFGRPGGPSSAPNLRTMPSVVLAPECIGSIRRMPRRLQLSSSDYPVEAGMDVPFTNPILTMPLEKPWIEQREWFDSPLSATPADGSPRMDGQCSVASSSS